MSEWKFPGMDAVRQYLRPVDRPAPVDAERRRRPLAERLARDTGKDTLSGRPMELSFPGGSVRTVDRSRSQSSRGREHAGSTEFAESRVRVDVSCRFDRDLICLRVERLAVVMPKDVTVTFEGPPGMASAYGVGRTLKEHEDAHVATGQALRNSRFVEDALRGRLSYVSSVTGETVRFEGVTLPAEFRFSARQVAPGQGAEVTASQQAQRVIDAAGQAIVQYLQDIVSYIDDAENHGPPLPTDPKKTPYRTIGGRLSLLPPPKAPVIR